MLNKRIASILVTSMVMVSMVGCGNQVNTAEDNDIEITEEIKSYNNRITKEECEQNIYEHFPNYLTEEIKNGEIYMYFNEEHQTLYLEEEIDIESLESFIFGATMYGEEEERRLFSDKCIDRAKAYSGLIDENIKEDLNADITVIYIYHTPYGYRLAWVEDGEVHQDHFHIEEIEDIIEKEKMHNR